MSYSGTVRCSMCYKTGHNKSGCPSVLENYKTYQELIADYKKKNPDVDLDESYMTYRLREKIGIRYKHLEARSIIEAKKLKNTSRKCTYCEKGGHNRRTCGQLVQDINLLFKAQKVYSQKVANAFHSAGTQVGSLVEYEVEEYDNCKNEWVKIKKMGIIKKVHLDYNIWDWARGSYQSGNTVRIWTTDGKENPMIPVLPKEVQADLLIGYRYRGSSYTVLTYSDTPMPPPEYKEEYKTNR